MRGRGKSWSERCECERQGEAAGPVRSRFPLSLSLSLSLARSLSTRTPVRFSFNWKSTVWTGGAGGSEAAMASLSALPLFWRRSDAGGGGGGGGSARLCASRVLEPCVCVVEGTARLVDYPQAVCRSTRREGAGRDAGRRERGVRREERALAVCALPRPPARSPPSLKRETRELLRGRGYTTHAPRHSMHRLQPFSGSLTATLLARQLSGREGEEKRGARGRARVVSQLSARRSRTT